jgi:hypothetical protein
MKQHMSIEEIEAACIAAQPLDFLSHPLEAPDLTTTGRFYPMGFPADVRSNSAKAIDIYREAWQIHRPRYDTEPINIDVHVIESNSTECPPAPSFRMTLPLMVSIADADNYSVFDLERATTTICISEAALSYPLYAGYFFLEAAAACHIVTKYAAPVHAGCVEWNGRGLLLCGDSGAGKSTLSYACARSGFGYVSDDATFVLRDGDGRTVIGNPHKVRMRPESVRFFPEMENLPITPRAAGKPSIEIPTPASVVGLDETYIDSIIFLNRRTSRQELLPYRRDVAREFMRQVLYGMPEQLAWQYDSIERLLKANVYELRYTELDWAIDRLRTLAQDGR